MSLVEGLEDGYEAFLLVVSGQTFIKLVLIGNWELLQSSKQVWRRIDFYFVIPWGKLVSRKCREETGFAATRTSGRPS